MSVRNFKTARADIGDNVKIPISANTSLAVSSLSPSSASINNIAEPKSTFNNIHDSRIL